MFFKKVINIIISLIIPFGYTTITKSSSIKNATITSFQKISLNTVFSSIADYQCLVKPTAEDVINYLAQNVSTSYSDILDNIQIDSISDSRVVFSALPYSYRYIGTLTFNYRIANKVSLKSVFNVSSSNQTIDINDNFNYDFLEVNTITKFLQKLKPLYPTLDINQLVVTSDTSFPTIKDNATNRYLVSLSPAVNNIYYVEDNSFIINFIFDGRGFNDFTIVNGNFNVQYNSSITSQLAINDILPIADSYTYSLTSSLPSSVLSVTDFGMITMNSFNDLTLQSGHVIDYSITAIATKAEYSNKSITTSFTITIIASEDTEWAEISAITNGLHQRNYSIGRIPNDSFTLNTIYIGMTYGTTLTYSLVSNPNSAVVLTGSTIKPNTSMASSGLKEYTIKVTLTNSNFPNTISYEQSFQIRYGAATRFSLTTDTGGYWNAAANSTYSGYPPYRAFDTDTGGQGWCSGYEWPAQSSWHWICFYPDNVQDLYITGFVFVGGQGASFYGPSLQITLSGARKNNASTSGLTEFFSATSSLPSTQSQYYGTTPWNTNYCNVFLNMRTSRQWLEITDFFIYV